MLNFTNIARSIRKYGPAEFLRIKFRSFIPLVAKCAQVHCARFDGARALEIGGPSFGIFGPRGLFPVYERLGRLDNVNFSTKTVWEGAIAPGDTFRFSNDKSPGQQYILEATNLSSIDDASYDAFLSSHTLEHTANPIKALREAIRVLKPSGFFLVVLPHKEGTFDHRRPTTTIEHMQKDFDDNRDEADLTHLEEIISLNDFRRSPEVGTVENFRAICLDNFQNRRMHHHVFTTRSAIDLIEHVGMRILAVEALRPYHILILAQNIQSASKKSIGFHSPFAADQGG
jgi:SAM-dependent methyltransferase